MSERRQSVMPVVMSLLAAAVLSACASSGQVSPAPKLDLPVLQSAAEADLSRWWLRFEDAQLSQLIDAAFQHNSNLKVAVARVEESAALLRISRSYLFPTVDASMGATRSRSTEVGLNPAPSPIINNTYTAGINVAYELDLWGRVRSGADAASARYLATREAQNALRSSLAAQVAQTWFTLLALDQRLALARNTLATREEALRVQNRLFAAGSVGPLSVRQAESERESVAASIPRLLSAQANTERALSVLIGASPRAIVEQHVQRSPRDVLPPPPSIPGGLDSELLARRPDIREAEATLVAASASVKEARADFFPRITLTGSYGRESTDLSDLFTGPAAVWNLAAGLTQPIFGAGRIHAQVDAAEARRKQAEANYVYVVQGAFREVYDSLGSVGAAGDALQAQERQVIALRETQRIAQRRYEAGLAPYLEVLDAQRNLLSSESARIETQAERLISTVDVFRALGGGWESAQN